MPFYKLQESDVAQQATKRLATTSYNPSNLPTSNLVYYHLRWKMLWVWKRMTNRHFSRG